jgi:hypothetical protein
MEDIYAESGAGKDPDEKRLLCKVLKNSTGYYAIPCYMGIVRRYLYPQILKDLKKYDEFIAY